MTATQQLYEDLTEWLYDSDRIEDVGENLLNPTASHNERAYIVYNLDAAGVPLDEIVDLIDRHNQWANYDRAVTEAQVRSVVKSGAPSGRDELPESNAAQAPNERYVFSRRGVGPFRGIFNEGANGYAKNIDTEREGRFATFREVGGEDHTLLVIDMDADVDGDPTPEDLEAVWVAARKLYQHGDWWLLKFSGRKGFHVIDKLDGQWTKDELRAEAQERMEAAGVEYEEWADPQTLHPTQPIRCINSEHMKSGLHSVIVNPQMTLRQVLRAAENPGMSVEEILAEAEGQEEA